jgi:hypothetical protein
MRLLDLFETPITDFEQLGDFDKPGAFRNALDKKLVTHPTAIERIRTFFKGTEWDLRFFVCNKSGTGKHAEHGQANAEELVEMFGEQDAHKILSNHENAITVVFVGNGGADRMPLTPWVMAHRVGHAIRASWSASKSNPHDYWKVAEQQFFKEVNFVLRDYYNISTTGRGAQDNSISQEYCALFNAIGTQRSSVERLINRPYEFLYESFAQYLHDGAITYNPIPSRVGYGSQAWGKHVNHLHCVPGMDEDERREVSGYISNTLEANFRNVMYACEDQIFVM